MAHPVALLYFRTSPNWDSLASHVKGRRNVISG